MTGDVYALSEHAADALRALLAARAGVPVGRSRGGGSQPLQFVQCTSSEAVGGSAVLDQCYPAQIVRPASDEPLPVESDDPGLVLLTLFGPDGESVQPTEGAVYLCALAGETPGDGGIGSQAAPPRLRAFGASGASPDAEATVHYKKVYGPSFTITADGTWQDTGVSIILPEAGTYVIDFNSQAYGQVSALAFPSSVAATIATRFYDVTNSVVIDDSFTFALDVETVDRPVLGNFLMRCVYTVTGQTTIRAEAYRQVNCTWTISVIGNSGADITTIGYQRLDVGTGGPAGPAGPQGPAGPAGTPGANAPDDANAVIGSRVFGF